MDSSTPVDVELAKMNDPPEQTTTIPIPIPITFIDSALYKAAAKGEIQPFNACTDPLDHLLTPIKNTIFQIHITHRTPSVSFLEQCLTKCPSLLLQTNSRGETPLHIAARHGHLDIVKFLIDSAKGGHRDIEIGVGAARAMLRMENIQQETALHEAARLGWFSVVEVLISEDPDYTYSANKAGETPLYLAAERGFREIMLQILHSSSSPAFHGPNGRTALHEAVIRNDSGMVAKILQKNKMLVKEVDQHGCAPLHHASYFGHLSIVKQLLECDKSVAYIGDKDGKIPLHLAAAGGGRSYKEVVHYILQQCPDCHELADANGRNVLHYAVMSKKESKVNHLFRLKDTKSADDDDYFKPLLANLINEKDVDGNTPVHLAATYCICSNPLLEHPLVDKMAVNNSNFTPLDNIIVTADAHSEGVKGWTLGKLKQCGYKESHRNFIEEETRLQDVDLELLERLKNGHVVVAALIVTVTFAAGFTMPGGYNGEEGSAILSKNGAFKTFIITDAIALLMSTCALFFHFTVGTGPLSGRRVQKFIGFAAVFIMVAIVSMLMAFAAGVYAVLPHSSNIRAAICVITSFFFIICYSPLKVLFV